MYNPPTQMLSMLAAMEQKYINDPAAATAAAYPTGGVVQGAAAAPGSSGDNTVKYLLCAGLVVVVSYGIYHLVQWKKKQSDKFSDREKME